MMSYEQQEQNNKERLRWVLDSIDTVLAQQDGVSHKLWDVLTGLRGPDSGEWNVKQQLTVPIRRAAFPQTAALAMNDIADFGYDSSAPSIGSISSLASPIEGHLENHVLAAARALDILGDNRPHGAF